MFINTACCHHATQSSTDRYTASHPPSKAVTFVTFPLGVLPTHITYPKFSHSRSHCLGVHHAPQLLGTLCEGMTGDGLNPPTLSSHPGPFWKRRPMRAPAPRLSRLTRHKITVLGSSGRPSHRVCRALSVQSGAVDTSSDSPVSRPDSGVRAQPTRSAPASLRALLCAALRARHVQTNAAAHQVLLVDGLDPALQLL